MAPAHNSPSSATVLSLFSTPRTRGYLEVCGGDGAAALELYRWNSLVSGAFWETLGHLEVALRNVLADRLAQRHARLGRPGAWMDSAELDSNARRDIAKARRRARQKGIDAGEEQVLTELSFGFWRFLLAKRYTGMWPDLADGFPGAPDRARTTIEQPVIRLHQFRNRLAHHERIWTHPLQQRHDDIVTLLGYIDPDLHDWVVGGCRVSAILGQCPVTRPRC